MDACSIWQKLPHRRRYCDEVSGVAREQGIAITELSTHLQGQLVAVNPVFDEAFDAFAPQSVHGKPKERHAWAVEQLRMGAKASKHLGLKASVSFTGALAWPFVYPWPPRPPGLIEGAFAELARRWKPILDAYDDVGCDICYEIHPSEDTVRRRHFRDVPRRGRRATSVLASTMIRRTSYCSTSTIWRSLTSITSGSRPST